MPRWPVKPDEPEVAGIPVEEPKDEVKPEEKKEVIPNFNNSGEYWRSLNDEQKKAYIGAYSNPYVKVSFPDVVELAWSEYLKIPKGETK